MTTGWLRLSGRWAMGLALVLGLSACGGGGGVGSGGFLGGGGGDETLGDWLITLELVDAAGNPVVQLSEGATANLTVTVTDSADPDTPIASEVVTAEADLVTLTPASGTAATNSDGQATFILTAGGAGGAASVVVSATSPSGLVSTTINFNIVIEGALLNAALLNSAGAPITIVDPLNPGLFTVTLTNAAGEPVAGELVAASTTIGTVSPGSGTALTDASGTAVFLIEAGADAGAGTLTATVARPDGDITDTVNFAVSNELPYTLTPVIRNAEGDEAVNVETAEAITLEVEVLDASIGGPVVSQIVSADIGDLGAIIPESGNSLTDANGIASFAITVGDATGAFPITVSAVLAGGTTSAETSVSVQQAERILGFFDNDGNFIEGEILIQPAQELSPTGTAALTVAAVDAEGNRTESEEVVTFTSECLFGGQATLDPVSPVTFTSQVTVNYTASGCSGTDIITATLGSTGSTATGSVRIGQVDSEVISFVSTVPEVIGLRDTGNASDLAEKADVSFLVSDLSGNPVTDAKVVFSLSTYIGGLALACRDLPECDYPTDDDALLGRSITSSNRSDLEGIAVAEVLSGFIPTPVRVFAFIDLDEDGVQDPGEPISASKVLTVTTGLPDQDSISLSASVLNVEGAYEIDGLTSDINLRMADKLNNPVPDGTQAVLTTEYGRVVGSCFTADGNCTVLWNSQSPRNPVYSTPITIDDFLYYGCSIDASQEVCQGNNGNFDDTTCGDANGCNNPRYDCPSHNETEGPCPNDIALGGASGNRVQVWGRGGRSTVSVVAIGEESFVDTNGNGLYDDGEFFTNLPEAFRDDNEDGVHTPSQRTPANFPGASLGGNGICDDPLNDDEVCRAGFDEDFVDFNLNGVYDLNNTPNGGLYNGVLCREADEDLGICSRELLNVRDSLVLILAFDDSSDYDFRIYLGGDQQSGVSVGNNYIFYLADRFNNPPPPGASVTITGEGQCDAEANFVYGDINSPGAVSGGFGVTQVDGEPPNRVIATVSVGESSTRYEYPCGGIVAPEPEDPGDGGDGGSPFLPGT